MRILFVHSPADLYGASRALERLCVTLTKRGAIVGVILPEDSMLATRLREKGIEVIIHAGLVRIERDATSVRKLLQLFFQIPRDIVHHRRMFAAFRPDVVHTNNALLLAGPIAAKLCGYPHLWHIRENFSEFPTAWTLYRRVIVALSTKVVANSEVTAGQFQPERQTDVRIIYNGLPQKRLADLPKERVEFWRRTLSPEGGPLIGVLGRIKLVRKGQDVFVKAASLIADRFPNARFACVGGPYPGNDDHLHALRALIEEAGLTKKISVTGDIEDPDAATAALDISVMPSVAPEPFGNVIAEAMRFGKPVIGTSNGGAAEQIEHGVTGLLVPPNDPEALAQAMAKLLSDSDAARKMGEAGQRRFAERFTDDVAIQSMIALYREILPKAAMTLLLLPLSAQGDRMMLLSNFTSLAQ